MAVHLPPPSKSPDNRTSDNPKPTGVLKTKDGTRIVTIETHSSLGLKVIGAVALILAILTFPISWVLLFVPSINKRVFSNRQASASVTPQTALPTTVKTQTSVSVALKHEETIEEYRARLLQAFPEDGVSVSFPYTRPPMLTDDLSSNFGDRNTNYCLGLQRVICEIAADAKRSISILVDGKDISKAFIKINDNFDLIRDLKQGMDEAIFVKEPIWSRLQEIFPEKSYEEIYNILWNLGQKTLLPSVSILDANFPIPNVNVSPFKGEPANGISSASTEIITTTNPIQFIGKISLNYQPRRGAGIAEEDQFNLQSVISYDLSSNKGTITYTRVPLQPIAASE
jgi:hypothetical protein